MIDEGIFMDFVGVFIRTIFDLLLTPLFVHFWACTFMIASFVLALVFIRAISGGDSDGD